MNVSRGLVENTIVLWPCHCALVAAGPFLPEVSLRLCLSQLAMEQAECGRREELGVELYSVQQQLAQLQAALEGRHEADAQAAKQRLRAQEQLEGMRSQYHAAVNETGQQRVQGEAAPRE